MEFYKRDILERIGNSLGKTVKINSHSLDGETRFVAVCTLVDDQKMLPKRACIRKVSLDLFYVEGPMVVHRL